MALFVLLLLLAVNPALSADPQPIQVDREERVEVQLVQLNFLARDTKGRPVVDLGKDEIQIIDNGAKQEIAILESYYGARAAAAALVAESAGEAPSAPAEPANPVDAAVSPGRWIVLFFDNYAASQGTKVRSVIAAQEYIREQLRPNDRVAVISFAGGLDFVQSFTSEPNELLAAVDTVASKVERAIGDRYGALEELLDGLEHCRQSGLASSCAQKQADAYENERFREADAFFVAVTQVIHAMSPIPDIKMLVMFSDGFSRFPASDTQDAVRAILGFSASTRMLHSGNTDKVKRSYDRIATAAADSRISIFAINPVGSTQFGSISARRSGRRDSSINTEQIDVHRRSERNYHDGLVELSRRTGGVSTKNPDVLDALEEVINLSAGLYTVAYYPTGDASRSGKHNVRIKVKRKGVKVDRRREVKRNNRQPLLNGDLTLTPQDCSEGRRLAGLRLRLDRAQLKFERVRGNFSSNFSMFVRVFPENGVEPIFEDYHYLNITNTKDDIASGKVTDPMVEQTLNVPCAALRVEVTATDAGSGAKGRFTATIDP